MIVKFHEISRFSMTVGTLMNKCAFDCIYSKDTAGVQTAQVIHTL